MFQPHPNLCDLVNRAIVSSEIEGGVHFTNLPDRATLEVQTTNRCYTLVLHHDGSAWISGHPEFCPEPVLVKVDGSNFGGSMIMTHFLGRGMHMEFRHPNYPGAIITSRIVDIKVRAA